MEAFLDKYGYIALMIGTFLEGETAMLVASSLSNTGIFKIPYIVFFGFTGSFISDWIYYLIGRANGKYFLERRPKLKEKVKPITRFFHHHKVQILMTYRFLYGFRVIIPLVIGMSGVRPIQYLGYSVISGMLWASLVTATGYFIGKFLNLDTEDFEQNIFFIIAGFATFGMLVGYVVKRVAEKELENRQHRV